jgi:hypothetical protein
MVVSAALLLKERGVHATFISKVLEYSDAQGPAFERCPPHGRMLMFDDGRTIGLHAVPPFGPIRTPAAAAPNTGATATTPTGPPPLRPASDADTRPVDATDPPPLKPLRLIVGEPGVQRLPRPTEVMPLFSNASDWRTQSSSSDHRGKSTRCVWSAGTRTEARSAPAHD